MKIKMQKRSVILLVIALSLTFCLFQGPLFPWSPVKGGFEKITASKASLYITKITEKDSVVFHIDEIIKDVEAFYDLDYRHRFKIIVVDEEANMKRYLPWLKGSSYSVSLSMANLIYIGPAARRATGGMGRHLKHELSHLLIDQNTSSKKALKMHAQGWFLEGIAEYFSGHSFYTRQELMSQAKTNQLDLTTLQEKNPLNMTFRELQLKYSHYRYFIAFLAEKYGMQKLRQYLKVYIRRPDAYKQDFAEVYGIGLDDMLKKYQVSIGG